MSKKVIDLSKFNPVDDWAKVKAAVDAVILRLGYRGAHTGTITYDPKYQEYMAACQKHGIPTMIYFFPCSISVPEAEAEANFIIAAAKKVKLAGPIWLDSEVVYQDRSGRSDNLGKADRTKYLNVILRRLHDAGYECGVYASKSWFAGNLNDSDLEPYCLRWVAQWADQLTYTGHDVALWQYTNNGSIPGINGRVDVSRCYIELGDSKGSEAVSSGVTRTDIVRQVCSWEGWSESNGKYRIIIDIYNYYLPTAVNSGTLNYKVQYSDEWCATAASAAYIQAGAPELFPIECGCPRNITLAKKMGIWQEADDYVPEPADAVLYDWQDSGSGDNAGTPDHIGIVISVDKAAGTFVVMEGNKDETVASRTMKINGRYIRGFITPKFNDTPTTKKEEVKNVSTGKTYEISKTGTPNKTTVIKWGLLKNNQKVTPRLQPDESAKPCSFSPVQPLTRIEVYDYITTTKRWAYCKVSGKYGFILASSIRDYLRTGNQTIDKVVDWVIADDFGTLETRRKALEALGYDYDAVQAAVTAKLKPDDSASGVRLYAPRFWDNNPDYYGDETIFIEGKKGTVFDTGMSGSLAVSKVQALGLEEITIVLTHPHADHTGCAKQMVDKLPVKHVYIPDVSGIRKYQKSYAERMDGIAEYCKKKGVSVTWVKMGDSFAVSSLKVSCIFQADADKLTDKTQHHFLNNMSMVYRVTIGSWRILIGGDLSAEGILQMMGKGVDYSCDVFKFFWHGDRGAIKTAFANSLKGVQIAYTQYEKKEGKGNGRADTYNLLRNVGAFVARAYEDGEINVDFHGATAKLTTSLGITRTFVRRQTAYKVSLTTKAKAEKGSGLLAIEPEDYTAKEVQALKRAGYTVLAYMSVGSVSDERSYYKQLEPYTLRKLDDWEHERYLDVCEPAVQDWLINRGMALLNAGYDGIWADNIDVYEEYPSDAAYKGITRILQALYPHGYIMINGGMEYMLRAISQKARVAHGVTQEEVFSLITDYSGRGTFGAQIASESLEYQKYISKAMGAGMEAYLLEYTRDANLKKKIVNYCEASGAGYYISEDVDL